MKLYVPYLCLYYCSYEIVCEAVSYGEWRGFQEELVVAQPIKLRRLEWYFALRL